MPNWTEARITVADEGHTRDGAKELMDFIQHLRDTNDHPDSYHLHPERAAEGCVSLTLAFHPMPTEVRGEVPGANPPWLVWATANWGVKWPDSQTKIVETSDDRAVVECRFPWTLASVLLAKVSALFPLLTIAADWSDEYDGAWYSTRFQAGEMTGHAERPDLELADREKRRVEMEAEKAEYITEGWVVAHDFCDIGRCVVEDCPMSYASDALKAHLEAVGR